MQNTFTRLALGAITALSLMVASSASATVLTTKLNMDNTYEIYVSTADDVQGTSFGSGSNWEVTFTNSTILTAGTNYYLHVRGVDLGGIAGFLGEFSLAGTHKFSNGLTSLTTNTSNWMGNNSGFNGSYTTLTNIGPDGVGPWGNRPAISDNANWIWAGDATYNDYAFFTTKITAVPEPTSIALLGLGMLGLGLGRRRMTKPASK